MIGVGLSSREQFWRYEHPQRHFPFYPLALSVDGTIVIGGRDRMVHAIDQASGEGRWTFRTRTASRRWCPTTRSSLINRGFSKN